MITLSNVSFTYQHNKVLDNVSCIIKPGTLTAIFGPNGTGKTTFLKIISGILTPNTGQIKKNSSNIGFLVQRNCLDFNFPITVFDVVSMGLYWKNGWLSKTKANQIAQVVNAMEEVGLNGLGNKTIGELSGGQFQRALFARLIVQDPDIILLDEPFNAVDCKTLQKLMIYIKKWHKEGKTILVVLHDFELIKQHFFDCILLGNQLLYETTINDIMSDQRLLSQIFFCGNHLGKHEFL